MEHLRLTCRNHLHLRWMCKEVAVTQTGNGLGYYNGQRNIFFLGSPELGKENYEIAECTCPASDLILAPRYLVPAIPCRVVIRDNVVFVAWQYAISSFNDAMYQGRCLAGDYYAMLNDWRRD